MDTEQTNLSPEQVLGVVRRRARWILMCFVLVVGAVYGISKHQTKEYTATAWLVFNNNQNGQQVAGLQAVSSNNQLAQQNTNLKLVQIGDMAEKTAALLGRGLTEEKVGGALSISAQGESNIVDVVATAASPVLAASIANTYTTMFVKEQESSNHAYYASALRLVNKQLAVLPPRERAGAAGLSLQDRAQSLATLAELRNGNVQIAKAAKAPKAPSSPKVAKNTIIGGVLGLLLGLGVAFLLERFDRRIREPKDLEGIYGLPLLGVVPESSVLSRSAKSKKGVREALPAGESESFQLIRAHLRYLNIDRGELHTLMIASAAPGDGKTTIARHLAGAAARMGSRVLLLEADLRRPTLAEQLDVQSGPGLADVLIGAVSLGEAIQVIDLGAPSGDSATGRTFDVLVAGAAMAPNPSELIESRAMETLLGRVKSAYDFVVIDTPPLTAVSDAFPLLSKVDGVVIVGRVGRNRRDVAERLHETLSGAGAPLLGVIANGFKDLRSAAYSYAYDYSRAPKKQSATSAAGVSPNGAVSADEPVSTTKG
jgi:polysaccharide biosynthesis transport protein